MTGWERFTDSFFNARVMAQYLPKIIEGFGLTVAEAQLAVDGGKGKYPEFKGNVRTVETRDFFPKVEDSPKNQGFHYHQNAGTYMQIGEAMGKGMLELLKSKP